MQGMKVPTAESPAPSDPDRSPEADPTESLLQGHTVGDLLWAIFDPHLQRRKAPLPGWKRFAIALSGSGMLFVVFYVNWLSNQEPVDPDLSAVFTGLGYGPGIPMIVAMVLSIYFAALVAVVRTKAGPVRLFLAGLLVPALACNVVQWTWN